ncbi:MAG: hypothetical protein KAF91_01880 [Nostoc sp. TH1S01]|nr:hypothetical protein [Nostoc sp. TH1S01]
MKKILTWCNLQHPQTLTNFVGRQDEALQLKDNKCSSRLDEIGLHKFLMKDF